MSRRELDCQVSVPYMLGGILSYLIVLDVTLLIMSIRCIVDYGPDVILMFSVYGFDIVPLRL